VSEAALLRLLFDHPHPAAIGRRVDAATLYEGLSRLERAGLVARRRGLYLVTDRGRRALRFNRAVRAMLARTSR
jgi:DNA-binding PadR family transcriptional regulator